MSNITVILPAFNEEVAIGSVILRTKQYANRVIVVDDGSSDQTVKVARLAGAEVIVHPINMGKGAALRTGFGAVNGADIIMTLDTDGQHNPDEIPKLIAPIISGMADVVNGSRYVGGNGTNTPLHRRVGQTVLDKATKLNCGLSVTDSQSGFRAFSGHTLSAFRFKENGFGVESQMLGDAARAGFRIVEVEIGVRYDVDGSTEHSVSHGVKVLVTILQDMEFNRPLYYFTVPGVVLGMSGLVLGMSFMRTFYLGESLNYVPTLLMILLTLIGTFMTFTGIILHSVTRLIHESKFEEIKT